MARDKAKQQKRINQFGTKASVQALLESRILLDAALVASADTGTETTENDQTTTSEQQQNEHQEIALAPLNHDNQQIDEPHTSEQNIELVFVDQTIQNYNELLQDLFGDIDFNVEHNAFGYDAIASNASTTFHIYLIAEQSNGIAEISQHVAEYSNISSLHILSHADNGKIYLGESVLSQENLSHYEETLSTWSASLNDKADILLYGCNIANDNSGIEFINKLAQLTQADIAASSNLTGSLNIGGDFNFEYTTGNIETALSIDLATLNWQGALLPTPEISFNLPSEEMINENFNFSLTFDNTDANEAGFGPFIDFIIPQEISGIANASYLGTTVNFSHTYTWDGAQWLDGITPVTQHPFDTTTPGPVPDGVGLGLNAGDVWHVIELPFGSFSPTQPNVILDFTGNLNKANGATVGSAINLYARAGFRYGTDALDNPGFPDATLFQAMQTSNITPIVVDISKTINLIETETTTGANYPFTQTITIDIASGEQITNVDIAEILSSNVAYQGTINVDASQATAFNGQSITDTPTIGSAQFAPNNNFLIEFTDISGSTAVNDVVITFTTFIPEFDANGGVGNEVLDPITGDSVLINTQADITYNYNAGGPFNDVATASFTAKSIIIQKSFTDVNAGSLVPGDTIESTLAIIVSDFFGFDNLIVNDVLSDGQRFAASFTPILNFDEDINSVATLMNIANYNIVTLPFNGDGTQTIAFRISDQMTDSGHNDTLEGDEYLLSAFGQGQTTASVIYRATISENFDVNFPSGDSSVDVGDVLTNTVTLNSEVIGGAEIETDTSSAQFAISGIVVTKSIYAIDGVIGGGLPNPKISPGMTITYRLTATIPSGDIESLVLTDFLPQPIFSATEISSTEPGNNEFGLGATAAIPTSAGLVKYGPSHTLLAHPSASAPDITTSTANGENNISFDFGTFDENGAANSYTIDLLFRYTVADKPFADGLFLTNQAETSYGTTQNNSTAETEIVQVELEQPNLNISKGVVLTNAGNQTFNPASVGPVLFNNTSLGSAGKPFVGSFNSANLAANPVNSDLSGGDARDIVRFAIVIENTGSSDGFNLKVTDQIQAGYQIPLTLQGFNVEVYRGDGTALSFVGLESSLFGAGLEIVDPGANDGAIKSADGANGENIVVITYELQLLTTIEPNSVLTDGATIVNYGAIDGGNNYTTGQTNSNWSDNATVTTAGPLITKSLVSTSVNGGGNNATTQATIGETLTYQLVITIPEGITTSASITDTLDAGLSFASLTSVTNSIGVSTSLLGGFGAVIGNQIGNLLTFNLGLLTNIASSNATPETVTITYTVVVDNEVGNQSGTQLNNSATFNWDPLGITGPFTTTSSNAANVTVVEPNPTISSTYTGAANPDGNDTSLTFRITITAGSVDVFDINFSDVLPALATITAYNHISGVDITGAFSATGSNSVTNTGNIDLLAGQTSTFDIVFSLGSTVDFGEVLSDNASITWTSLNGAVAGERTGAGGVNDYVATDNDSFTIDTPTLVKTVTNTSIITPSNDQLNQATIGEEITYQILVTVPEGESANSAQSFRIIDTLDLGLSLVAGSASIISPAADLSAVPAGFGAVSGSQLGQVVTFNFGRLTNTNNDNGTDETFILQYRVKVDNFPTNVAGQTLNNSAIATWQSDTLVVKVTPATTDVITVLEPDLEFNVSVEVEDLFADLGVGPAPTNGDAGDFVRYTITLDHSALANNTNAYDVDFQFVIPNEIINFNIGTTTIVSSPDISIDINDFEYSGNTLRIKPAEITNLDFDVGDVLTITIDGNISGSAFPNATYSATASSSWTSLDGASANERTGAGAFNDYSINANAAITINPPIPSKIITNSSVALGTALGVNAAIEDVVIGEVITYRIISEIPEGVLNDFIINDLIPTGLIFVEANGVRVGFVSSNGTNINSVATGAGLDIVTGVGNTPGYAGNTPDDAISGSMFTLFDDNVSSSINSDVDIYNSGTDIYIKLGDLTNSDSDADAEYVVVEFDVRVENIAANQSTSTLVNRVDVLVDSNGDGNTTAGEIAASFAGDNNSRVEVLEPTLAITQTIISPPANPDAGDLITYEITLNNSSSVAAFDIDFNDILPLNMTVNSISHVSGSVDVTGFLINGGTQVTTQVGGFDLAAGQNTVFRIIGILPNTTTDGLVFTNSPSITWTSIDGADPNERTGAGGINDYSANDSDNLQANFVDHAISKTITTTSDANTLGSNLTIGERVTYTITATFSEGTTNNVTLLDQLNTLQGILNIDAASVVINKGANISTVGETLSVTDAVTVDTFFDTLTITYNSVINSGSALPDPPTAADQISVTFDAIVVNQLANQAGDIINNNIDFTFTDETGLVTLSANTNVTLVEPALTLTQAITSTTTSLDSGDVVDYQITINNSSGVAAYDIDFNNLLPGGITINNISHVGGSNNIVAFLVDGGTQVSTLAGGFDLLNGENTIFTIRGILPNTVVDGQLLANTPTITWTSINGIDSQERTGSGGINDYSQSDTDNVTTQLENYAFVKSIHSTSSALGSALGDPTLTDLTIGDTLTFDLVATFAEGTTNNITIIDNINFANGILHIDPASIQIMNGATISSTVITSTASDTNADTFNDRLTVTLNPVINSGNDETFNSNDTITIRYTATVMNVLANQQSDTISNTASFTFDNLNALSPINSAPLSVELFEPTLTLTQTIITPPANPDAGDIITYEMTITNTSNLTAFDIDFNQLLPAGMTVASVTHVSGTNITASLVNGGTQISTLVGGFDLAQLSNTIFRINVVIPDTVIDGQVFTTSPSITWSSVNGADANERTGAGGINDYSANDSDNLQANFVDHAISKTITTTSDANTLGSNLTIGERVTYTITATFSEGTTNNVTLLDQLNTLQGILNIDAASVVINKGANISTVGETLSVTDAVTVDTFFDTLTITYNSVINSGSALPDPPTAADQITVTFDAIVVDQINNSAGDVINNQIDFRYIDESGLVVQSANTNATLVEPNLTITTQVSDNNPDVGNNPHLQETLSYTLTISHPAGSAPARNILVNDLLPVDATVNIGSISVNHSGIGILTLNNDYTITPNGNGFIIDVINNIDLQVGQNLIVSYDATVTNNIASIGNTITNNASVTYDTLNGVDPNERTYTANDNVSATIENIQYQITKDNAAINPQAGDAVSYNIILTNTGNIPGTNLVINDFFTLPLGINLNTIFVNPLTANLGGIVDMNSGTVTWNIATLNPGVGNAIHLTLSGILQNPLPAAFDDLTNTASISDDNDNGPELTSLNNTATDSDPVGALPDYDIVIDNGIARATPGQLLNYNLTVKNIGSQNGTSVIVTDIFDKDSLNILQVSHGGIINGNTITWQFANFNAGQIENIVINAAVKNIVASGDNDFQHQVTIVDDGLNGPDFDLTNNSSTDLDILDAAPDYAISITDNLVSTFASEKINYIITLKNIGNQNGENIIIVDEFLPEQISIFSASNNGIINSNTITWHLAQLNVGHEIKFTIIAKVNDTILAGIDTVILNQITVKDDGFNGNDLNIINNSALENNTRVLPSGTDMNKHMPQNFTFPAFHYLFLKTEVSNLIDHYSLTFWSNRIIHLNSLENTHNLQGSTLYKDHAEGLGESIIYKINRQSDLPSNKFYFTLYDQSAYQRLLDSLTNDNTWQAFQLLKTPIFYQLNHLQNSDFDVPYRVEQNDLRLDGFIENSNTYNILQFDPTIDDLADSSMINTSSQSSQVADFCYLDFDSAIMQLHDRFEQERQRLADAILEHAKGVNQGYESTS